MPQYDANDADVFIYTRRDPDAMLSSMGHDLKIRVADFSIEADFESGNVEASFRADSLEPVDSVIWENKRETGELSDGDRHEISERIDDEVLDVDDYPEIEFSSSSIEETDYGWRVRGTLELHGHRRDIEFDVERRDDRARLETSFDYTEYDIEAYSAMLGSLRVAPEVVIEVEIPLPSEG